jgi:hypothetical protein
MVRGTVEQVRISEEHMRNALTNYFLGNAVAAGAKIDVR